MLSATAEILLDLIRIHDGKEGVAISGFAYAPPKSTSYPWAVPAAASCGDLYRVRVRFEEEDGSEWVGPTSSAFTICQTIDGEL